MKIILKRTKISLSEEPDKNVPSALMVVLKGVDPIMIDVIQGKQTYKLPQGANDKDVLAIYLRVY